MNARPNAWMHQAQQDLALAQLAQDNGFQAAACFHASQAAEKALKSALLELGLEPPFTHVLNTLVSQLQDAGINTQNLERLALRQLSRMAVQSRYPMDATPASELFDQEDAYQALTTAKQVLSIIQALDQQA